MVLLQNIFYNYSPQYYNGVSKILLRSMNSVWLHNAASGASSPSSGYCWTSCRAASHQSATPYEPDFSQVRRDGGKPTVQSQASHDPRLFTYFMVGSAGVFAAVAAKSAVADFVTSLSATGDTLAQAQTEVDISAIPEGKSVIIKWRGKPVFIRHRTSSEIGDMAAVDLSELRDPQTDAERTKKPEWLVMLGICTHLGCVPLGDAGDFTSGWYCPCHGSHYDVSGRIRKGPAPLNLEIPKYDFIDEKTLLIG